MFAATGCDKTLTLAQDCGFIKIMTNEFRMKTETDKNVNLLFEKAVANQLGCKVETLSTKKVETRGRVSVTRPVRQFDTDGNTQINERESLLMGIDKNKIEKSRRTRLPPARPLPKKPKCDALSENTPCYVEGLGNSHLPKVKGM